MARTVVNVTASSTLDGRDISADGTKLDGIEANATADQTAAEIKSLVEASSDIALAGNPTTTTQSSGNNSTRIATTAFVTTAVAGATIDGISSSADATAITIDSSENVGIGTSPSFLLHVKETPGNGAYSTTTNMDPTTRFHSSEATTGSYTAIQLAANNGNSALGWWNIGSVSTSSNYDNHLVFQTRTGSSSYAERMRIDDSGNVGIGTDSPNDLLHIKSTSADAEITLESTNSGGDARIRLIGNSSGSSTVQFQDEGDSNIGFISYLHSDNAMTFRTSDGERMRINTSGNVGIGTTSPDSNLHISNSAAASLRFERNDTTITAGNAIGQIHFEHQETGYAGICATLRVESGNNNGDGEFVFQNGVAGTLTEKMRIDRNGRVGIGTASPASLLELEGADPIITLDDTSAGGYAQVQALNGSLILMADEGASVNNSIVRFDVDGTERMRIDSAGRVGIGRTPTDVGLEVAGPSYTGFDGPATIFLYGDANYNAAGDAGSGILFGGEYTSAGSVTTLALISGIKENTNNTDYAGALTFQTRPNGSTPVERMRINSSGNVGIGTTDIGANLSVRSAASASITNVLDVGNAQNAAGTGHGARIRLHCTPDENRGVAIASSSATNYATDNHMLFYTSASSTLTERMRIDSSGKLLVNRTGTITGIHHIFQASNPSAFYRPTSTSTSGVLYIYSDVGGTETANLIIAADGDVTNTNNSYSGFSDERLKSNIVDASSQIDDIMAMQVRSYTLNSTGARHIGVVAQELEASGMSGLVQEDEKGIKSVKYSVLYMKAIKALQEAVTRIETLEAEVATLKGA